MSVEEAQSSSDRNFHRLTCTNCRKKKARCDGAYPHCVRCKTTKQKCVYDKPASISYVRHLERQVEALTASLASHENRQQETPNSSTASELNEPGPPAMEPQAHRDADGGLEFNVAHLSELMEDLDIRRGPAINYNSPHVSFNYISDTLRFAHYFEGSLHKDPGTNHVTGSQMIRIVQTLRECGREMVEVTMLEDFIKIGQVAATHGFPYLRPHYASKYYRDYSSLFVRQALGHVYATEAKRKWDRRALDSKDAILAFALSSMAFYRAMVPPTLFHPKAQEDAEDFRAKVVLSQRENLEFYAKAKESISREIFSPANSSFVQACLHASMTEMMLGISVTNSLMLSNYASRMAIDVFDHYSSQSDQISTRWFLRVLWSCYIWDKITASTTSKNPVFPQPPPVTPSEMDYNALDTLPCIDKDGNMNAEIDGRAAVILTCRLSVILSDILLRRHHYTHVRIQMWDTFQSTIQKLPAELTWVVDVVWDGPVLNAEPLKVIKLPQNYPIELILPIAMSLVIELELLCESFVNIAEHQNTSNPNLLEDKSVVFQRMIKSIKACGAFGLLASEVGPYHELTSTAAYINPWYRLAITKSIHKLLFSEEAVKMLVLLSDEVPSAELNRKNDPFNLEFADNPQGIPVEVRECILDPTMPAEVFVQNLRFIFGSSSNFRFVTQKEKHYYLKYICSVYISLLQASMRRLSEFSHPDSKDVLTHVLRTIPTVVSVFGKQHNDMVQLVSQLPNPKFDADLLEAFSYVRLQDAVHNLFGKGAEKLMLPKSTPSTTFTSPSGRMQKSSANSSSSSSKQTPPASHTFATKRKPMKESPSSQSESAANLISSIPDAQFDANRSSIDLQQAYWSGSNASPQSFNAPQQQPQPQQMSTIEQEFPLPPYERFMYQAQTQQQDPLLAHPQMPLNYPVPFNVPPQVQQQQQQQQQAQQQNFGVTQQQQPYDFQNLEAGQPMMTQFDYETFARLQQQLSHHQAIQEQSGAPADFDYAGTVMGPDVDFGDNTIGFSNTFDDMMHEQR